MCPRAILHIDGDAFFTSCEEVIHPELKGKPIISDRHGKHKLHLGASHLLEVRGKGKRGNPTVREQTRLYGETGRRHLGLPIIHVKMEN